MYRYQRFIFGEEMTTPLSVACTTALALSSCNLATNLYIDPTNGADSQTWEVKDDLDIVNPSCYMVLDVYGGQTWIDGANIILYSAHGLPFPTHGPKHEIERRADPSALYSIG